MHCEFILLPLVNNKVQLAYSQQSKARKKSQAVKQREGWTQERDINQSLKKQDVLKNR